jgi:glycosyltransferase involved in cell wall biosynthesis
MKPISVIIPVYNVAAYILKCLESINNQSFKDFCIVIVDDCGQDDSIAIANTFLSKTDIDYTIIRNGRNLGISESRNAGLAATNTEYILFIDPDDWIENTMLEELYNEARNKNADIVCCNAIEFWEKEGIYKPMPSISGIYNSEEYLEHVFNGDTTTHMWLRMFKRELFQGIQFTPNVIFEDFLILPYLVEKANSIVHLNKILYTYVQRSNSTNLTASKPENVIGFMKQLNTMNIKFNKDTGGKKALYFIKYQYMLLSFLLSRLLKSSLPYKEIKAEINEVRAYIKFTELLKVNSIMPKQAWGLLFLTKTNARIAKFSLTQ